jgi:uncharacterized protein
MFTTADIVLGLLAALIVGLSKTAIPGAGLLATPLLAHTFHGRTLPGAAIGILLLADLFAVKTYRHATRWDVLRPLAPWVAAGFAVGAAFFVAVGKSSRTLDVVIGVLILLVVVLQADRMVRKRPPTNATHLAASFYGVTGGFATFISNNAGPILNTYLSRLGLAKEAFIGTSSWFYFVVNLAKIPLYLALGAWSTGGGFFSRRSMLFDLVAAPGVFLGVWLGRRLFHRIHQTQFLGIVLVLSAIGAVKLLIG